jgi:Leucine-rich repeat (LRR) protein
LHIENTGIKELPNTIGNLSKLKSIWLSDNDIQKLPNEFCTLKSLEQVADPLCAEWSQDICVRCSPGSFFG